MPSTYDTQYHSKDTMLPSDQRPTAALLVLLDGPLCRKPVIDQPAPVPDAAYSINPDTPVKLESAGAVDDRPS